MSGCVQVELFYEGGDPTLMDETSLTGWLASVQGNPHWLNVTCVVCVLRAGSLLAMRTHARTHALLWLLLLIYQSPVVLSRLCFVVVGIN